MHPRRDMAAAAPYAWAALAERIPSNPLDEASCYCMLHRELVKPSVSLFGLGGLCTSSGEVSGWFWRVCAGNVTVLHDNFGWLMSHEKSHLMVDKAHSDRDSDKDTQCIKSAIYT